MFERFSKLVVRESLVAGSKLTSEGPPPTLERQVLPDFCSYMVHPVGCGSEELLNEVTWVGVIASTSFAGLVGAL